MFKQPIVKLYFFFCFSIAVLMTSNYQEWLIYFIILIITILSYKTSILDIFSNLKPILYYFPMMLFFYLVFSFFLTDNSINQIINEAFFGFIKIILMISAMSLFFKSSDSEDFVNILRSMWVKANLAWKWPEKIFVFLSTTLRFYPTVQSNWDSLIKTRRSLGFDTGHTHIQKIKIAAKSLPSLILYQLHWADDIAIAMKLRGFGNIFPRGVVKPVNFRLIHFSQLSLISFSFWALSKIGTL